MPKQKSRQSLDKHLTMQRLHYTKRQYVTNIANQGYQWSNHWPTLSLRANLISHELKIRATTATYGSTTKRLIQTIGCRSDY